MNAINKTARDCHRRRHRAIGWRSWQCEAEPQNKTGAEAHSTYTLLASCLNGCGADACRHMMGRRPRRRGVHDGCNTSTRYQCCTTYIPTSMEGQNPLLKPNIAVNVRMATQSHYTFPSLKDNNTSNPSSWPERFRRPEASGPCNLEDGGGTSWGHETF